MIYNLPPTELDDTTLEHQIDVIITALIETHAAISSHRVFKLEYKDKLLYFVEWAAKCRANYLKLVNMGLDCLNEYNHRFDLNMHIFEENCSLPDSRNVTCTSQLFQRMLDWAAQNDPDPPGKKWREDKATEFPVIAPEHGNDRNHYIANMPKDAKWTRREKPYYLNRLI